MSRRHRRDRTARRERERAASRRPPEGGSFRVDTHDLPNPRDPTRPLTMWRVIDRHDDEVVASGIGFADEVEDDTRRQVELLMLAGGVDGQVAVTHPEPTSNRHEWRPRAPSRAIETGPSRIETQAIAIEETHVISWKESNDPFDATPPTQVWLLIRLRGMAEPMALRYKSPVQLDELIAALTHHRIDVFGEFRA